MEIKSSAQHVESDVNIPPDINGWGLFNLWGLEYVKPSEAQFKFYVFHADVAELRELYTLGGRATRTSPHCGTGVHREALGCDRHERSDLLARTIPLPEESAPVTISYGMQSGNPLPDTKMYFSLHGCNDLVCVEKVRRWFEIVCLHELAASYHDTVQSYL
jgi:hypothetical protein